MITYLGKHQIGPAAYLGPCRSELRGPGLRRQLQLTSSQNRKLKVEARPSQCCSSANKKRRPHVQVLASLLIGQCVPIGDITSWVPQVREMAGR